MTVYVPELENLPGREAADKSALELVSRTPGLTVCVCRIAYRLSVEAVTSTRLVKKR